MTDRELLEKAAKAAGVPHKWNEFWRGFFMPREDGSWEPIEWNPLEDDGDALRLAVRLEMQVDIIRTQVRCLARGGLTVYELDLSEPSCAATRRAIVRAAASLAED